MEIDSTRLNSSHYSSCKPPESQPEHMSTPAASTMTSFKFGNSLDDWQTTKFKLAERGRFLLDHPNWSDCSFLVGTAPNQQTFSCHKLFLALSSPVFEAMFYGGMAEKVNPVAILDVQPDAFKALLEYIYTDAINLQTFDQACELCYAAKKYMLPHVVEECTKFLWTDLYPNNVCRAYEFAKLFEEPQLMERCLEIMQERTDEVINEPSFEDIEQPTLVTLLEQDILKVSSELELFEASMKWARKEVDRKGHPSDGASLRAALGSAFGLLRFLTLSAPQFTDGPALSELLTRDESFTIMINISSPGRIPVAEGLSTNVAPRERPPSGSHFSTQVFGSGYLNLRDNNKSICQRIISQQTQCYNTCNLDCSVTFTVDRNICVYGIQLPTQVHHPAPPAETHLGLGDVLDSNSRPRAPFFQQTHETYTELIYAHLLDSENSRLTYTHFTSRVRYNSLIDINFNRPVFIQKNKEYRIWVVLNKLGYYPVGRCSDHMSSSNVNFRFCSGENTNPERGSIIRSIIFTRM